MADSKLTALPTVSTASPVDLLYLAHDPSGSSVPVAISASSLFRSVPGSGGIIIGGDANLYRKTPNVLQTDDSLTIAGDTTISGSIIIGGLYIYALNLNTIRVDSSAVMTNDLYISTGNIYLSNNTSVFDTKLYRSSASTLKTDGNFVIAGSALTMSNAGTPTIYFGTANDVNLYRDGTNSLRTDDAFTVGANLSLGGEIYIVPAGNKIYWGDSVGGYDTSLYRGAASQLKTTASLAAANHSVTTLTYTPSWTGSSSNPSIGNGSLIGRYNMFGKICFLSISILAGSTTTFGGGQYSLTLPARAANINSSSYNWYGIAHIRDSSTANYVKACQIVSNGSTIYYHPSMSPEGANINFWTSASPFTFGNGDSYNATIWYEVA